MFFSKNITVLLPLLICQLTCSTTDDLSIFIPDKIMTVFATLPVGVQFWASMIPAVDLNCQSPLSVIKNPVDLFFRKLRFYDSIWAVCHGY